jgi:ubiquitin C-terminal hydrolase
MNNDKNKCFIPPVGLINLSRKEQKTSKKNIKKIKNLNKNLYNTCYINSSIQCLFRLEDFINNLLNCSEGKLSMATKNLIIDMRIKNNSKYHPLSVSDIKKGMIEYNENYNYNNPEDVNEFISDYLNILLKETRIKNSNIMNEINTEDENYSRFLKKSYNKGHSFISDLFYGVLRTKNYCKNCDKIFIVNYQSFNILDMPIYYLAIKNKRKSLNIEDIITAYISEKEFSNAECQCGCKIYTKTDIYKLPKYLIMYFERKVDNYYIENDIDIKKSIDLKNFVYEEESDGSCYNLKGIIYYSLFDNNIGHYTASCLIDNKWFYFDDDNYENNEEGENEGDNDEGEGMGEEA